MFRAEASNNEALKHVVGYCRGLQYLELKDGLAHEFIVNSIALLPALKTLIVGRECALDLASQILQRCTTLTKVEFVRITTLRRANREAWPGLTTVALPGLQSLKLHVATQSRVDTLQLVSITITAPDTEADLKQDQLFEKTPNLRELDIKHFTSNRPPPDFAKLKQLVHLRYQGQKISQIPPLPTTLSTLDLDIVNCHDIAPMHPSWHLYYRREEELRFQELPALTRLTLSEAHRFFLSPRTLRLLSASKATITNLHLFGVYGDNRLLTALSDYTADGAFANLTNLLLCGIGLDDKLLALFAEHCPALERASFDENPKITGVGVRCLVEKKGEKLDVLSLMHCEAVSVDAVEWARSEGVTVYYGFPSSRSVQGKKVRYGL